LLLKKNGDEDHDVILTFKCYFSGVAIGAGIAIPFTFGLSAIVAAVAGGVAAAVGGVAAGGAGIFKYIIDKKALREAEKKWIFFCNMFVKVSSSVKFIKEKGSVV
jgi:hypothetical protein